ncbi:hypothetical protein LguiA_021934 [Lonicera macranthoides]
MDNKAISMSRELTSSIGAAMGNRVSEHKSHENSSKVKQSSSKLKRKVCSSEYQKAEAPRRKEKSTGRKPNAAKGLKTPKFRPFSEDTKASRALMYRKSFCERKEDIFVLKRQE